MKIKRVITYESWPFVENPLSSTCKTLKLIYIERIQYKDAIIFKFRSFSELKSDFEMLQFTDYLLFIGAKIQFQNNCIKP